MIVLNPQFTKFTAQVWLVDEAEKKVIQIDDMLHLNDEFSTAMDMACKAHLVHILPSSGQSNDWSEKAIEAFTKICSPGKFSIKLLV